MKKQVILIIIAAILFIGAIVGASFLLAGKSQQESMDHGAHIAGDTEKLNSMVGKEAPDFTLASYDGKEISLKTQRGKKVVLFFTEGAMCYPSCWNQIDAFGKDNVFNNQDTITLSIMVDTENEWKKAVDKMPELGASTVLLDVSRGVSREYGMLSLPSSMHKGQYPGHTYLILDKDGIIRYVMDDPQMAVRNDQLKAELEKLN
jgi:thioredoxin-dependent peroxiredoxin